MSTDIDPPMSAAELAARWDTSQGRLANLRSAGQGPSYTKIGSRVLYPVSAVLAYESEHMVATRAGR